MKNPFERGPLMAPADGGDGGGGGKRIEFKSKKIRREPTEAEKREIRENQLNLVPLWREDGIKWLSNENEGRIRPTPEDIDRRKQKLAEIVKYPPSKEIDEEFGRPLGFIAEAMVLELLDSKSKTQPYIYQRGPKVIREGYNLLQEQGFCYYPSEIDDLVRGTDGILLVSDPENGQSASPISLDITIAESEILNKRSLDMRNISEVGEKLNEVYWYDSRNYDPRDKVPGEPPRKPHKTYHPGERFKLPKEGKIASLNLSVYVPEDLVRAFGSRNSTFQQAHDAMETLGPYVLNQMKVELSEIALRVLGMIRMNERTGELEVMRAHHLDEILEKLEALQKSPKGAARASIPALRRALEVVYREEEDLLDRDMGMRRVDALRPSSKIQGFYGFRTTSMAAE